MLHQLTQWRKSLRKEIKQRKAEVRIRSRAEVGSASDPKPFLNSVKVQQDIQEAFDSTTTCTSQQHKLILAYVAANIIFTNAQRPGVVQHMSVQEYENKEDDDEGNVLIKVLHHKTSSSSGEADIMIKQNIDTMIQMYIDNIRVKITPSEKGFQDRLFLTHTGNEFRKISETIKEVAKNYGYDVPNATLNRKVTATSARENLSSHDAIPIHRHMSHTPETSMRNYQYPDFKDSIDTRNTITILQSKKYFSENEDRIIVKEWPITNEVTPALKCCRAIVAKYQMARTAKQVQDRWKTLFKNSK